MEHTTGKDLTGLSDLIPNLQVANAVEAGMPVLSEGRQTDVLSEDGFGSGREVTADAKKTLPSLRQAAGKEMSVLTFPGAPARYYQSVYEQRALRRVEAAKKK